MRLTILKCILALSLIVFIGSCSLFSGYPSDVKEALSKAGGNKSELKKVISHFKGSGDSLMLQAAYYLIGNMEGHSYTVIAYYDTSGKEVPIDVNAYPDYLSMRMHLDSVEAARGTVDYDKKEVFEDLKNIKADFLINQIEYAFKAWRTLPWTKSISFADFKEYILPYRGSNEPLEPWRQYFYDKYHGIDTLMSDPTDLIEAARIINRDVRSYFGFSERYYLHPTDQGLSEMLQNGLGRCEDMTNLAIYAMRANGLAVTSDYTPYWATTGNNHAWNAIVDADGNVVPFMGAEADPGNYLLSNRPAKVYRKMFGYQKDNLIFQNRKQKEVPRWLAGKSYIDVTSDYVDVCDVTITFRKQIPDSVDIAYLCVFNSGEWQPIQWGKIENNAAVFTDMGVNIMYLPALFMNEKVVPWGPPTLLRDNCDVVEFQKADGQEMQLDAVLSLLNTFEISKDGVNILPLNEGVTYELLYWDDDWKSAGKLPIEIDSIEFGDLPTGCLYWLAANGSDKEERIFTLEDGKQVWW